MQNMLLNLDASVEPNSLAHFVYLHVFAALNYYEMIHMVRFFSTHASGDLFLVTCEPFSAHNSSTCISTHSGKITKQRIANYARKTA